MQLSKNYTLQDFTKSSTALKLGISNEPTAEHLDNIKNLCIHVLEPLCEHFGIKIYISSGYRSDALNKIIHGALSSQHLTGQAVDIDMDNMSTTVTNQMVFDYIKDNIVFDQLINEYSYSWVHVSFKGTANRHQVLDAVKVGTTTKYNTHK